MSAKKLKIGFVIDDGLDRLDGVQQYILTLGKWFTDQGHEVHYLTGETKRTDIDNVHVLSKNLKVRFNANRLSTPLPASKRAINKVLNEEKFDVLHVQVPYSPFMAARVVSGGASKGTAIVGTFHILPYGFLQRISVQILGKLLKRNLKRFDKMFAVSPPAAELCQLAFGVEPDISPNSVDISAFASKKKKEKDNINIVFLGRLVERKGCAQLIKAISYINSNKLTEKSFNVSIGGDGPDRRSIENMISSHKLGNTVKLHGFIDESAKADFLAGADIAVFPSLGGESFGIVLLEAMAAGSGVVIGGDNPGYRSVMGELPDSLVDCTDEVALAKTLAELINDSSLRKNLHGSQQKLVSRYDVSEVGEKLQETYWGLAK